VAGKLEGRIRVAGPWENCRHSLWALDHYTPFGNQALAEAVANAILEAAKSRPDGA
jgi:hypothetical protein